MDECYYCRKTKDKHYFDPMRKTYQCYFGQVISVILQYKSKKEYENERQEIRAVEGDMDQKCDEGSEH